MRRSVVFLVSFVLLAVVASSAPASPVEIQPPVIEGDIITLHDGTQLHALIPLEEFEFEPEKGKYKLKGEFELPWDDTAVVIIEEYEFDPDPSIMYHVLLTNITDSEQTYTFELSNVAAFGAPNQIHGSVTTQIIDEEWNGATISAPVGGAIYNALIDDNVVATMQEYDFSLSADPGDVNSSHSSFGWQSSNIPVTQSIGIRLDFTLSAGDTASILSRFDVVPEPATICLLGLGAALLRTRRRR